MACETHGNLTICRPSMDAWERFFTRCPVCRVRRLCLAELQDYYGWRCTCLTCGTGWMDGECRKGGKREGPKIAQRAKDRIRQYIADGIPQGTEAYSARLKAQIERQHEASHAIGQKDGEG